MKRILGLIAAVSTAGTLIAAGAGAGLASETEQVSPADVGTDWYLADTRPPGTGTFEEGPAAPPLGTGSFELRTPTAAAKVQLLTDDYDGVALADIDGIGYSTYRDPTSTGFVAGVAALNLRVDLTGDGQPDAYMVFEPYQDLGNAAVQTGVWQDWDAYRGGAAKWWLNTGAAGCGQATPCTWNAIVTAFPNASVEEGSGCGPGNVVTPCPGSLGVNQGSGNSGITTNVDRLYVSVAGAQTVYDFELADADGDGVEDEEDNCVTTANPDQADEDNDGVGTACDTQEVPMSKDDCKNGGYRNFNGDYTFRNQGECVSFVATKGRNKPRG